MPEKGRVTSSLKMQTPADWLPVSDVNYMPSSVFRCISVFQVYFGVYTDPRFCSNLVKLTTYYTGRYNLKVYQRLPSGWIWRSKIEFTVKNQQLCSWLSHIKNGNTRKQWNVRSTTPVMWRFCHSSNAAVTSETKVCAGARSAQPGNKLCGLR